MWLVLCVLRHDCAELAGGNVHLIDYVLRTCIVATNTRTAASRPYEDDLISLFSPQRGYLGSFA
jgi:hypothetical protein